MTGHPIIAIKEVVPNNNTSIQLVVQFVSVPNPSEIRWFLNDSIISKTDTHFKQELYAGLIQQEMHSKKVKLPGFKAHLEVALHLRNIGLTFSCQIRNIFGTRYVSFEGDLFADIPKTFEDNEHHIDNGIGKILLYIFKCGSCNINCVQIFDYNKQFQFFVKYSSVVCLYLYVSMMMIRIIICMGFFFKHHHYFRTSVRLKN